MSGFLENLEAYLEIKDPRSENLSAKIFSETVCNHCSCKTESSPIAVTDNMGRENFWEDLGRP